jgi:hypothetical protein
MATVLPSSTAYRVSALINQKSLEDCGIAAAGSEIRPYFANSVVDDPDIAGLLVYLQTPGGLTVGDKIRYTLASKAGPASAADTDEAATVPIEKTIPVTQFSGQLPAIPFPAGLAIGRYILVFEVLGLRDTLYREEKALFFLGSAELALDEIVYYRSEGESSSILPPGMTVMLEARISADPRLHPWLVWYDGKNRINEGPVADGFIRIFWKAPEQTGFQTLRAELFPFEPQSGERTIPGYIKELSLPVSAKFGNSGQGTQDPVTVALYRLEGDVADSRRAGQDLRALDNGEPLWLPGRRVYGLALGPVHAYAAPSPLFTPPETGGTLRLSFSFIPLKDAPLLNGSFALKDNPLSSLNLELACLNGDLVLVWALGPDRGTTAIPLRGGEREGELLHAALDFVLEDGAFSLALGQGEPGDGMTEVLPRTPGIPTGQGVFRLGGAATMPAEAGATQAGAATTGAAEDGTAAGMAGETPDQDRAADEGAGDAEATAPALILDEFSLIFFP